MLVRQVVRWRRRSKYRCCPRVREGDGGGGGTEACNARLKVSSSDILTTWGWPRTGAAPMWGCLASSPTPPLPLTKRPKRCSPSDAALRALPGESVVTGHGHVVRSRRHRANAFVAQFWVGFVSPQKGRSVWVRSLGEGADLFFILANTNRHKASGRWRCPYIIGLGVLTTHHVRHELTYANIFASHPTRGCR
jgi:hypothetical protein